MEPATILREFDCRGLAAAVDPGDFFGLVAPMGKAGFLAGYWEKQPCLVRGAGASMAGIVDLDAIDAIVGGRTLRPSDLRAARGHRQAPPGNVFVDGVADKQLVLDTLRAGYTLVFDQVNRHLPALARALHAWETTLQLPVRANAYLTPRGTSGFDRHFDTHDVVVVQLHGSKRWDVCDAPLALPHEEQQGESSLHGGRASLLAQVELAPGDVLYLPRGQVHAAAATTADSLHLSISIRNRALREVAFDALRSQLLALPEFRRSHRHAGPGMAELWNSLSRAAEEVDMVAALERAVHAFQRRRLDPNPKAGAGSHG